MRRILLGLALLGGSTSAAAPAPMPKPLPKRPTATEVAGEWSLLWYSTAFTAPLARDAYYSTVFNGTVWEGRWSYQSDRDILIEEWPAGKGYAYPTCRWVIKLRRSKDGKLLRRGAAELPRPVQPPLPAL
jgi:hypothetical protein